MLEVPAVCIQCCKQGVRGLHVHTKRPLNFNFIFFPTLETHQLLSQQHQSQEHHLTNLAYINASEWILHYSVYHTDTGTYHPPEDQPQHALELPHEQDSNVNYYLSKVMWTRHKIELMPCCINQNVSRMQA